MSQEILTETRDEGRVAVITLNRAERHNALNLSMWQRLATEVRQSGADEAVRVIVVRGAGERAFASGADLHELATHRQTREGAAAYHAAVEAAFAALAAIEQPVLALIHGYCIGGGCELALACDLRFADEGARFGIPAAKLGIVLGVDELRRLGNAVGIAAAKEILFSGRLLDAGEALRVGLVNGVLPAAELDDHVFALASQIAENDRTSIAAAKTLLDALGRAAGPDELHATQREFVDRAAASGASRRRIGEFVNRRRAT